MELHRLCAKPGKMNHRLYMHKRIAELVEYGRISVREPELAMGISSPHSAQARNTHGQRPDHCSWDTLTFTLPTRCPKAFIDPSMFGRALASKVRIGADPVRP